MLNDNFAKYWSYSRTFISKAYTETCVPVAEEDESLFCTIKELIWF